MSPAHRPRRRLPYNCGPSPRGADLGQDSGRNRHSHTPTIGFALDTGKQKDPVWAPIFEGYKPVRQWLADKKPDVLFFIYDKPARP
jgi:hypothetical protein